MGILPRAAPPDFTKVRVALSVFDHKQLVNQSISAVKTSAALLDGVLACFVSGYST